MTTPGFSPFELGQGAGSSISKGIRQFKDTSAIDEILSNAQSQTGPNAINEAMGQILSRVSPQNQERALAILQNRQKELSTQQQQAREAKSFEEAGIDSDIAGLPKEVRAQEIKRRQKQKEETQSLEGALDIVGRIRDLNTGIGLGPTGLPFKGFESVRKTRAEAEQLGKSLISFATTIPIRNRLEFETLAGQLIDPNLNQAARAGVLDAMERILSVQLPEGGRKEQEVQLDEQGRRPLTAFLGA